jgi:predicted membrane-bound mannosyltransferase
MSVAHVHAHPSDLTYVKVALVLGVITAAEVSLPYITDVEGPVLAAMLVMMAVKFGIVGAMFMHLRFDSKLFRRLFIAGIALAAGVYLAVMVSMQFYGDDTTSQPLDELPHPASITTNN